MRSPPVTREGFAIGMTYRPLDTQSMIELLGDAREHWQRAAEYAVRGMWYESGDAQARADIAVRQVVEALSGPGQ